MTQPSRNPILALLGALLMSVAPLARADVTTNPDGDPETFNLIESMIEGLCPEIVSGLLQEEDIRVIVTDRAAFTTKICQCLVHAAVNDQRTYGLLKAGAELLELERNTRYFTAKLMSSSFRCVGAELDNLLINYDLDDGNASKATTTAKP